MIFYSTNTKAHSLPSKDEVLLGLSQVVQGVTNVIALRWLLISMFLMLMLPLKSYAALEGLNLPQDETFLEVSQAFQFSSEIGNTHADIHITIAPQYYLYKNKIYVRITGPKLPDNNVSVKLPNGESHVDEYFGQQTIFRDNLDFSIDLTQISNRLSLAGILPADIGAKQLVLEVNYQGCADKGLCYAPQRKTMTVPLAMLVLNNNVANAQTQASSDDVKTSIKSRSELSAADAGDGSADSSFSEFDLEVLLASDNVWFIVLMFFLLGLGLSFTPCVFPMYPILTGIIVGQGDKLSVKNAFILSFVYVQGMALTYTALGIVVAFAGMQFQAAFQHPAVLTVISLFFIFLALSMFGVFNLALPSAWQAKINNLSNKQKGGSVIGVLLMGVISGLVASPCTTAPLTAALIYIAQSGDVFIGALALYALSMGMGLPLILLGSSGGKLLPKAGAWMNIIKNVFGFLLLVVPLLLLARIIDGFYIDLLWTLLALSFATYLFVQNKRGTSEFWFGVRSLLILLIVFYTALYNVSLMSPKIVSATQQENKLAGVHFRQVSTLAVLQANIKEAAAQQKPVIVDLYADWCIACKEFEKYTFTDVEVQKLLENAVLLQIDLTDSSSEESVAVMEHFNVTGLPTILLFDKQGRELVKQRITGYLNAEQFAEHLQKYVYR